MKALFGYLLELSLLLSPSASAFGQSLAASSTERHAQITVRISNRVHLPADSLGQIEQVATQILGKAGVQAVWLDCSDILATYERQPDCDRPVGPTDFTLIFVEEIPSWSRRVSHTTLGFALVPDDGSPGDRAFISNHRAHDATEWLNASPETILGLAAAHEIGHLLMGSSTHSFSGLMRAQWDAKDLVRARQGGLRFTNDQVKRVNAGVLARMAQQTHGDGGGLSVKASKKTCSKSTTLPLRSRIWGAPAIRTARLTETDPCLPITTRIPQKKDTVLQVPHGVILSTIRG
jgi:hypothetical protein